MYVRVQEDTRRYFVQNRNRSTLYFIIALNLDIFNSSRELLCEEPKRKCMYVLDEEFQ